MDERTPFKEELFPFNVDLGEAVHYHLDLLELFNNEPLLGNDSVIKRAIWRYKQLWLPLAASSRNRMVAPLDVEWVWHCHMLSPLAYTRDCHKITGKIVDHQLFAKEDRETYLEETKSLWEATYPDEKFDILGNASSIISPKKAVTTEIVESPITYNIQDATARQKGFYYQVSLAHFRDRKFMTKALERYRRFLYLHQQFPTAFLVPSYDIDLMWHTHQLHPIAYLNDTWTLLGGIFNHDDSDNDRSPGSQLNQAYTSTRSLWKKAFGEEFAVCAAKYRGDSPVGKLSSVEQLDLIAMAIILNKPNLNLNSCRILNLQNDADMCVLARDDSGSIRSTRNTRIRPDGRRQSLHSFYFKANMLHSIEFSVTRSVQRCFFTCVEHCGSLKIGMAQLIEHCLKNPPPAVFRVWMTRPSSLDLVLKCLPSLSKRHVDLQVKPGEYETRVMAENPDPLWGPIPVARFLGEADRRVQVATHRLTDRQGSSPFVCRTVHCLPLMMSAVQVFYRDRMVVVAHLVGTEQLPLSSQISDTARGDCASLEPGVGERALLIKNSRGDWGVLTGRWEGVRKGVPGVKATESQERQLGKEGSPGYLSAKLFILEKRCWKTAKLFDHHLSFKHSVGINDMVVNFHTGSISSAPLDIPENLAVAFGLALLLVLCGPNTRDPGENAEPVYRGDKPIQTVRFGKILMTRAVGYGVPMPTNSYLYSHIGCNGCEDLRYVFGTQFTSSEDTSENGRTSTETEDVMDYKSMYGCDHSDDGETNGACGECGGCGGCGGCTSESSNVSHNVQTAPHRSDRESGGDSGRHTDGVRETSGHTRHEHIDYWDDRRNCYGTGCVPSCMHFSRY